MKKFLILAILLFTSCTQPNEPELGVLDDISLVSLERKYNSTTEIKARYQLESTALKMTVKDNPKDRIEIIVGNELQPGLLGATTDFSPKLKIARWDDEVNLTLTPVGLDAVAKNDKNVVFEGNKIKFTTPDKEYHLYDLPVDEENPEGAYEFEVILKEKPKTNVVSFTIQTKGLDFFYQPALTQEEIDEGAERPENVIGSYAVYASENKINWTGGKEYKVGKVGHIYRPKIVDSIGTEVWGDLNVDTDNGILSVTIPQKFLDVAVYPVKHAAGLTFGYTTLGSTNTAVAIASYTSDTSTTLGKAGSPYTLTENGTITEIVVALDTNTTSQSLDLFFAIYTEDSGGADSHGLAASGELSNQAISTTPSWYTASVSSVSITADDYILAALGNGEDMTTDGASVTMMYDTTSGLRTYSETTTGAGSYDTRKSENPWTENDTSSTQQFSIYATYTASGGSPAPVTPDSSSVMFFD